MHALFSGFRKRPIFHRNHSQEGKLSYGDAPPGIHEHLFLVPSTKFARPRRPARLRGSTARDRPQDQGEDDEGRFHDGHVPKPERFTELLQNSVPVIGSRSVRHGALGRGI